MSPVGSKAENVLEQLAQRAPQVVLSVEGHKLSVTNLDKVLWPGSGRSRPLTKRDLLRYLARVSPWLLPHLQGRPMFVTRYPDGITGKSFYQKHWDNPPEFVRTVTIYSSHTEGDSDYIICENLPPTDFTLRNVPDILEKQRDPWADILQAKQDLAALLEQRTAG